MGDLEYNYEALSLQIHWGTGHLVKDDLFVLAEECIAALADVLAEFHLIEQNGEYAINATTGTGEMWAETIKVTADSYEMKKNYPDYWTAKDAKRMDSCVECFAAMIRDFGVTSADVEWLGG
jgi:hypothetical protein